MTQTATALKPAVCRACANLQHTPQKVIPPRKDWIAEDTICPWVTYLPWEIGLDAEHWCAWFGKVK